MAVGVSLLEFAVNGALILTFQGWQRQTQLPALIQYQLGLEVCDCSPIYRIVLTIDFGDVCLHQSNKKAFMDIFICHVC